VAASPFWSWRNSASGTTKFAIPQFKQTTTSENTHTTDLSIFFSPGKWMPISALNLFWLTDPHDLQGIPASRSGSRASLLFSIVSIIQFDSWKVFYRHRSIEPLYRY